MAALVDSAEVRPRIPACTLPPIMPDATVRPYRSSGTTEWRRRTRPLTRGRTTTIQALTDAPNRPLVLMLAPGNDVMMARELPRGPIKQLIAGTTPTASEGCSRKAGSGQSSAPSPDPTREAYRQRNLIERMFNRLKGFRGVVIGDESRRGRRQARAVHEQGLHPPCS
jgi:hypothetical protein